MTADTVMCQLCRLRLFPTAVCQPEAIKQRCIGHVTDQIHAYLKTQPTS